MSIENPTFEDQNKISPEDVVKKIKEEAKRESTSVISRREAEKILEEANVSSKLFERGVLGKLAKTSSFIIVKA